MCRQNSARAGTTERAVFESTKWRARDGSPLLVAAPNVTAVANAESDAEASTAQLSRATRVEDRSENGGRSGVATALTPRVSYGSESTLPVPAAAVVATLSPSNANSIPSTIMADYECVACADHACSESAIDTNVQSRTEHSEHSTRTDLLPSL